jgi:hypothetical protein
LSSLTTISSLFVPEMASWQAPRSPTWGSHREI